MLKKMNQCDIILQNEQQIYAYIDNKQARDDFKHALVLKIINKHIIYVNIYIQNIYK